MKYGVVHQASYSRGQLLLRTIFGWLYIAIPHGFLLFFVAIWGAVLGFLAFWAILFTGKYPAAWFDYQVKLQRWAARLNSRLMNLTDAKAAFGLGGTSEAVTVEAERPERISRGLTLLRLILGILYVVIPHGFCLFFRLIASSVLSFLAWWAVLFSGHYPERWHAFNVGTYRWIFRVGLYMSNMTDAYPPFSGKE
ncbi:MAG TPA: DUF4389 domain-containing protein [Rectinemataceae bacterium]|nr:DUF4389 domain-containing protein [Rectinemataceae bacterium]